MTHDLTRQGFAELVAAIAAKNSISMDLAGDLLLAAGDALDAPDENGMQTVRLPDGTEHKFTWPDGFLISETNDDAPET